MLASKLSDPSGASAEQDAGCGKYQDDKGLKGKTSTLKSPHPTTLDLVPHRDFRVRSLVFFAG